MILKARLHYQSFLVQENLVKVLTQTFIVKTVKENFDESPSKNLDGLWWNRTPSYFSGNFDGLWQDSANQNRVLR